MEHLFGNLSTAFSDAFQEAVADDPIKVKQNVNANDVEQPTTSKKKVKGNPATLARLITKLDKKEQQIAKIKQEISNTEQEIADTKQSIKTLVVRFSTLYKENNSSDGGDAVLNDGNKDGDNKELAIGSISSQISDALPSQ